MAQLALLYGSEGWVVTGVMLKVLEGFHHEAARRITEMMAKRGAGGEWEYPSVVNTIRVHIRRWQANIADRVACRPIYELCMEAERITGMSRLV